MKRYTSVLASVAATVAFLVLPTLALADTVGPITFEPTTYTVGSINGQDGWLKTGAYDANVTATGIPSGFGTQSLQISDAVTSGSFGDQTFAKPLTDSVGETGATAGTFSIGTRQTHFEMQFDIASVLQTLQSGMHLSVSPDRGDGSRMSYLRFEDQADGIHVFFDDVTDPGPVGTVATFNESDIATISRAPHTIKLTMDVVDGPNNDVVKVYIDGTLIKTGGSWEDYYRYDPEASAEQTPRIVKTVEFRESGTANADDVGKGFLIDNFSMLAGPTTQPAVKVTINKFIDGVQATAANANSTSFPMTAVWKGQSFGPDGSSPYTLDATTDPVYQAVTRDLSVGGEYSTYETLPTTCDAGNPYALVGYTTGTTFEAAAAGTPSATVPDFTNMQSNENVIVWNKTCPAIQPQVHIFKYVDGTLADAGTTNSAVFPMETTFDSPNLGSVVNVPFTLSPIGWGAIDGPYEASFVGSNAGANYEADEVLTTPVVGAQCGSTTYSLVGYSSGDTLASAQNGAVSTTPPSFTNLQSDKYMIVWNKTCPTTGSVTVEKDAIGGNGTFNFTSDIPGHPSFTITTTGGVGSQTFSNITPGTYHVTEASTTGWTQTSSDCSAGIVVAAGAAPVCIVTNTKNPRLGAIMGTKFEDRDGDGKLKDGDHHRLSGWTIYLDTNNNATLDPGEPSTVTDSHGNYRFLALPAGTYHVREVQQAGWTQTYPSSGKYDINLAAGQIAKKKDFGNFKPGVISGMKFNDLNANHKKDAGEPGLANWVITIKGPHGFVATTTTDVNGNYSFTNLAAGVYKLSEVMQATWRQTVHPNPVVVQSSSNIINKNFGNTQKPKGRGDSDRDNDDWHTD